MQVTGICSASLFSGPLNRNNVITDVLQYEIRLSDFRIWDNFGANLTAASGDDLALTAGAFATGCPYITSTSVRNTNVTQYARVMIPLPAEYLSAGTISLRFAAGMLTGVAGTSATLDCEAYVFNRDTLKSGADLCTTAAQSCNSLTFAPLSFVLTPTSRSAGDLLDVRITLAGVDAANLVASFMCVAAADLIVQVKG